ncbi:MAG: DUF695 domain-containing protein [Lewinella sp.]|uniref:DUF695 domain-containing protein n=1 Tax=Lewinella sp. TaxID=2004506 RepID=UPI003D6ADE7A
MSFWKKLFSGGEQKMSSYEDFWNWFVQHEPTFYQLVKSNGNIAGEFLGKALPRLRDLREGFHLLTGMPDEEVVELIFSANGDLKNMVFIDEIIAAAPELDRWKFIALRQTMDLETKGISLGEHTFTKENISFYEAEDAEYPDEVNIVLVHEALTEEIREVITHGTYLFLDHLLGEWNFATQIDQVVVKSTEDAEKELVPITEIVAFLAWREKEFVEKYDAVKKNVEEGKGAILKAELEDGSPLIIAADMDLMEWDGRASHPWMLVVELPYDGYANNGLPDEETGDLLEEIEDRLMAELKDQDGYLNLGRQTGADTRGIYFACKEFKKSSKIVDAICQEYADKIDMEYDIYKDKYWRSWGRFLPQ